jgi:hypothetical protein
MRQLDSPTLMLMQMLMQTASSNPSFGQIEESTLANIGRAA